MRYWLSPPVLSRLIWSSILESIFLAKFFILLGVYFAGMAIGLSWYVLRYIPYLNQLGQPAKKAYNRLLVTLDKPKPGEINSIDVIYLVMRHLSAKKIRTGITIGGMSIGFGSIIFLLSLGYGFERLVVSRMTNLGEMKQVDVTIGQSSALHFNTDTVQKIESVEGVEAILPVVSVVSKVNFNNSVSDAVAYGVTSEFLQQSALKPIRGKIFEDDGTAIGGLQVGDNQVSDGSSQDGSHDYTTGQVAGATTETFENITLGQERSKVRYSVYPAVWKPVHSQPSAKSEIIGYTNRLGGQQEAREVWGETYSPANTVENPVVARDGYGNSYSPWIQDSFPIWRKEKCDLGSIDCADGSYVVARSGSGQTIKAGFITQDSVSLERYDLISASQPVLQEGKVLGNVQFKLKNHDQKNRTPVYAQPTKDSVMIQQFLATAEVDQVFDGVIVLGELYAGQYGSVGQNEYGNRLGLWIKAKLPLVRQLDCKDCEKLFITDREDDGTERMVSVFIQANQVTSLELPQQAQFLITALETQSETSSASQGKVLGITTQAVDVDEDGGEEGTASAKSLDAMVANASTSAGIDELATLFGQDDDIDWVMIASQAGALQKPERDILVLGKGAQKVALVNQAMLRVLGLSVDDAVGREFEVTFVFDSKLFNRGEYAAESEQTTLTIIGVLPEERTPAFYLPFSDLRSTGIEHYSQIKVVVGDPDRVAKVRQAIESMGFRTSSILDTVERINALFTNLRLGLLLFGLIALSVAALGMFNTLTVSLLEKTREVGLMKAIGMKSKEVKRLFLAESVVMGFSGGFFGLVLGYVGGKVVSIILSSISIASGFEPINATHIPLSLAAGVMIFAFLIGLLTGIYPAYRATKISALNALRYE